MADLLGTLLGFFFTICVFSYIFGDNVLFRLATYIFIGVSAGYVAVITWYNVIWPQFLAPLLTGSQEQRLFTLGPLVLSVVLLAKVSPRLSRFGNPAMAFLVGVGAATAIGGALLGTLFPQALATINMFDDTALMRTGNYWYGLFQALLFLIGALSALIFFHFTVRRRPDQPAQRPGWVESVANVGQGFIAIALGALFAGVYAASMAALVERLQFTVQSILPIFLP
jgi:hypothetical protein